MSLALQTVAAAIIFNGYHIAPYVMPFPADYRLVMPQEVPAFKQLVGYMSRYKELSTLDKWAPYEVFFDAHGLRGAALAPWLRGGGHYLQSVLGQQNNPLEAPETIDPMRWFLDIQNMVSVFDGDVGEQMHMVRERWDSAYFQTPTPRVEELNNLYGSVQIAIALLGLESQPQRINAMRRETLLHVWERTDSVARASVPTIKKSQ